MICQPCKQPFKQDENAIACDTCDQWFHQICVSMDIETFIRHTNDVDIPWHCSDCTNLLENENRESDTDVAIQPDNNEKNKNKVDKLRILVCNFQSIWSKRNSLEKFFKDHQIDVVIGSESHLKERTKNSEFLPPHYLAERRDREDGKGGVIIIYRDWMKVDQIPNKVPEIVTVKIQTHQKPVIVSACYRSMYNSKEQNKQLTEEITDICKKYKNHHLWIGGDFNLPDIDWNTNSITSNQYSKELNEQYLEVFETSGLHQMVNFTTRKKAILDLMLTNRPGFVSNCSPVPGLSDHDTAVLLDMICHPQRHKPIQRKVMCWNRTDFTALRNDVRDKCRTLCNTTSDETPVN
uniref:PHD-type domain-containing protein n=1 Tax=Clytia hemisphaerica TaxID=252671 RepID=A0A7M5WYL3_9CNID